MKHKLSITLLLLFMFIVTQGIGILVLNEYAPTISEVYNESTGQVDIVAERETLPFGMEYEEEQGAAGTFLSLITALIIAILAYMFLMRYDMKIVIRIWFMLVIFLALGLALFPVSYTHLTLPTSG